MDMIYWYPRKIGCHWLFVQNTVLMLYQNRLSMHFPIWPRIFFHSCSCCCYSKNWPANFTGGCSEFLNFGPDGSTHYRHCHKLARLWKIQMETHQEHLSVHCGLFGFCHWNLCQCAKHHQSFLKEKRTLKNVLTLFQNSFQTLLIRKLDAELFNKL